MTLNEYHEAALKFLNSEATNKMTLAALGLNGEAGEFADEWKKVLYHNHPMDQKKMLWELGDVLWYIVLAAQELGCTLEDVARQNLTKLSNRYPQGWDANKSLNRKD